jgi:hypothetical protein
MQLSVILNSVKSVAEGMNAFTNTLSPHSLTHALLMFVVRFEEESGRVLSETVSGHSLPSAPVDNSATQIITFSQ